MLFDIFGDIMVSHLPQGLKSSFASEVLIRDGPNELKPPKGTPEYVKFARQLAGGLQCLMWVAAVICLIAFGIQESQGDQTAADNVSDGQQQQMTFGLI